MKAGMELEMVLMRQGSLRSRKSPIVFKRLKEKNNVRSGGVLGGNMKFVVDHYFETAEFTTYSSAIDAGHPVFTVIQAGKDRHAVLILGYNTLSEQVIYMDPDKGYLRRTSTNSFLRILTFH